MDTYYIHIHYIYREIFIWWFPKPWGYPNAAGCLWHVMDGKKNLDPQISTASQGLVVKPLSHGAQMDRWTRLDLGTLVMFVGGISQMIHREKHHKKRSRSEVGGIGYDRRLLRLRDDQLQSSQPSTDFGTQ